jgi:hypothetical protein
MLKVTQTSSEKNRYLYGKRQNMPPGLWLLSQLLVGIFFDLSYPKAVIVVDAALMTRKVGIFSQEMTTSSSSFSRKSDFTGRYNHGLDTASLLETTTRTKKLLCPVINKIVSAFSEKQVSICHNRSSSGNYFRDREKGRQNEEEKCVNSENTEENTWNLQENDDEDEERQKKAWVFIQDSSPLESSSSFLTRILFLSSLCSPSRGCEYLLHSLVIPITRA